MVVSVWHSYWWHSRGPLFIGTQCTTMCVTT